jgi:putative aldouronate transport system substrate-binding protein
MSSNRLRVIAFIGMAAVLALGAYGQAKPPITLTMLVGEANDAKWNQLHDSPVQQALLKATGITLDIQYVNQDKYNVVVASGDLPDILRLTSEQMLMNLVKGGGIIALDKLLATNGKDIAKAIPQAITFKKTYNNLGSNNLYTIPVQVGPVPRPTPLDSTGVENTIGPTARWDLYKAIGAPPIKSADDYLAALAKMVKANPKTADGKTVYGVGFWSDWGNWPYNLLFGAIDGYYNISASVGSLCVKNGDPNFVVDSYSDTAMSPLWKSVNFFYKADKLGIFDKDSFVQKFADFTAKCTAGQELSSFSTWSTGDYNRDNAKDAKGFMSLPFEFGGVWSGQFAPLGWGANKDMAISSSCKYPDRAMDLINYFYTVDGLRTQYSGLKGIHWNIVNGKPQLLDSAIAL